MLNKSQTKLDSQFNPLNVILHGTAVINKMNNDIKNKRLERKKYQIKRSNKTKENKNKEKTRLTHFSGIKLKLNIDRRTIKLNKQTSVKCTKLQQHVAECLFCHVTRKIRAGYRGERGPGTTNCPLLSISSL